MENREVINRLRANIAVAIFMSWLVPALTVWLFIWGMGALALRLTIGLPLTYLWVVFAGFALTTVITAIVAIMRRPSSESITAILDAKNNCGGLLMSGGEANIDAWQEEIPMLKLPTPKWRNRRAWILFFSAALFVAISLLIPDRALTSISSTSLEIGNLIDEMEAQIDLLEEIDVLDEVYAKELKTELKALEEDASARDPIKTWEALDSISRMAERSAREAAEEMAASMEDISLASDLAEGLDKIMSGEFGLDAETMNKLMRELEKLAAGDSLENIPGTLDLDKELLEALSSVSLTPEQMKQLAKLLNGMEGDLLDTLKKLSSAKMIDSETLKSLMSCTNMVSAELMEMLNNCCNSTGCTNAAALCTAMCPMPGKGGINRGRGDAPMTWTDPSSEQNAEFKEEALPLSALTSLKDSINVGMSMGSPEESDSRATSVHGALATVDADGGEALKHIVLPKHKGTVERYFERRTEHE